jgi:hypothetical protein
MERGKLLMKTILLIAMLLAPSLGFCEWRYVGSSNSAKEPFDVFVDDNLFHQDKYVKAWEKIVYKESIPLQPNEANGTIKPFKHLNSIGLYDCKLNQKAHLRSIYYDENNQFVYGNGVENLTPEFRTPSPESVGEAVLKTVCAISSKKTTKK